MDVPHLLFHSSARRHWAPSVLGLLGVALPSLYTRVRGRGRAPFSRGEPGVKDWGSWAAAAEAVETCTLPSCPEASVPAAQPAPTPELCAPGPSPQSPARRPAQVAEIRLEMELRDEILPRAQNIQSRLDRQTIETEEV